MHLIGIFVMVLKNQHINTNTDYRYVKHILLNDEPWRNYQTQEIMWCFPQHKVRTKILKIFDSLELKIIVGAWSYDSMIYFNAEQTLLFLSNRKCVILLFHDLF